MLKKAIPFIFVFLWSTGFIGAKYGLPYASTGDFLTIRTIVNIACFIIVSAIVRPPKLTLRQVIHATITGVLVHGAYLSGVFGAIEQGMSAGVTAIIVGLQPLLTVGVTFIVLNQQSTIKTLMAFAIGFLGLYLVVVNQIDWHSVTFLGLSFAVIALFGITLGTLYQKRYCAEQPLISSVLWQYIGSLLIFLPIALATESAPIQWNQPFILALAWLVLALSVVSILLLMYMIEQGESTKVSSYFYLVPPLASLEAWLLFDEALSVYGLIGMALCALSVYLVIKQPQKLPA